MEQVGNQQVEDQFYTHHLGGFFPGRIRTDYIITSLLAWLMNIYIMVSGNVRELRKT